MTPAQRALLAAVQKLSTGGRRPASAKAFTAAGLPHDDEGFVQELVVSLKELGLIDGYREGGDLGWRQLWSL